ncbi:MAG: DUF885 domain-containing protein [Gammaproteobacteria bacterium]|nr:DUF885 domain-containing protein [Gammaproteobacteria bacterium]MDH5214461.1 DUF885 domain-containing protein [Gammaproteobacteria bacterium]
MLTCSCLLQSPVGRRLMVALLNLIFLLSAAGGQAAVPEGPGTHKDLLGLYADLQEWKKAATDLASAYTPEQVNHRNAELVRLQERMQTMGVQRWSVPERVDYLTVRAELDQQQFIMQVTRPWARDPVFYVSTLLPAAFTDLPVANSELVRLQQELQAVPLTLAAARENLTDVAADYADLAIRTLTMSDGVEDGYPYREDPPHGVIGWYEDLLSRAEVQPELRKDISSAIDALRDFHRWLVANRDRMNAENGVGKEALNWFVQNALLLPYSSEEMLVLAQRELDRMWAFYALERHRNRDLPEILIAESQVEYEKRLADTDDLVRRWLVDESFISIPDYIPKELDMMLVGTYTTGYNVPFIVRKTPPNFWEQIQFRDPSPDHLHAVIPGHRFDAMVAARNPNPIRRNANFGARWQGWAVYLEEAPLQAGLLQERPRTRELIYLFGLWRAARSVGDIYNQWNEMTAAETADYWMDVTPFLDTDVARKYAYLRPAPGHGLEYTIGNIQMFQLLGDRKRQLGDSFVLKDFHDEFISKGRIPIALIRYEMTGYDKDVEKFFNRRPLSSLAND